jgi:HD-GYP domain-containing protein (c-di-GMP phosphodiesterase class II)
MKPETPTVSDEKPPEADTRGFLPIVIETLVPTSVLDFDLFIRPERAGPLVLFRERTYPLEEVDLERLAEAGVETLYIPAASHLAYRHYLNEKVIDNDHLPPTRRYKVLRIANQMVFRTICDSGNVDRMVEFATELGQQMADLFCDQELVLSNLLPLMAHDYCAYTHVTNVCTCCLALASRLGVNERADLLDVAGGALLHDLGKRQIPPPVLSHRGRLSEEQREIVRRHPADGFRDLCLRRDLNWGQLMMVYQHHERLDGRGYPVGSVSREIHYWAQICKVADVFDALSSDRPHRKAKPIDQVLGFLQERSGTAFDEDILQCLNAILESKS